MESQRFDELARTLATGTTRRGLLKGVFGSAVGGALGMMGISRGVAKPADKVGICHITANGSYRYVEVSANALHAHEAHGDLVACPENRVLDVSTCECVCRLGPEACEGDSVFDPATCSCQGAPVACTDDTFGEICGGSATCRCEFDEDFAPVCVVAQTEADRCTADCNDANDCPPGSLCVAQVAGGCGSSQCQAPCQ